MIDLAIEWVYAADLRPNTYNPNEMDEETFEKTVNSIHKFGFIDPVTARRGPTPYEIIDGEHRWKAAKFHSGSCQISDDPAIPDLHVGMNQLPVILLDVDEADAEQLTIVLNELRGKPNPQKLAALVRDLATKRSMGELEKVLPLRRQQLAQMVAERRETIDWDALQQKPEPEKKERWVERVFRLPQSAADVVDEALQKVREDGVADDWKALELICADYVAGV